MPFPVENNMPGLTDAQAQFGDPRRRLANRMPDDVGYYPSGSGTRIWADRRLIQRLKKMYQKKIELMLSRGTGKCRKLWRSSSGRMMGALSVIFTNGPGLKLITISGDSAIEFDCDQASYIDDHGFEFQKLGKPRGDVFDIVNRVFIEGQRYTRSCAAQKLLSMLGDHLMKYPDLEVECIGMIEAWAPCPLGNDATGNLVAENSCEDCGDLLPWLTGGPPLIRFADAEALTLHPTTS